MSSTRQRMRITPPQPKVEWKTLAVTSDDPLAFARELEGALQEMTDGGYNISSQLMRNGSVIITGMKVSTLIPLEHMNAPTMPPPGLRKRIVEDPLARECGSTTDEVLYTYLVRGQQYQRAFSCMPDALRLVQEHLKTTSADGGGEVIPVCIITVVQTYFDVPSIPMLLKTFAEDLNADKPLE